MQMLLAPSEKELKALPTDNWNIPTVPDDAGWEDHAVSGDVECIIVPCVALDNQRRRLGHGRGYYDSFIQRTTDARLKRGLPPPTTIGVSRQGL